MNILIDSSNYFSNGSVNLGDIALYQAAARRLAQVFPGCSISIVSADPQLILTQCAPLEPIAPNDPHALQSALSKADLVLLSGGGYFSDNFADHAIRLLSTLDAAQTLGRATAIMSPGFEPVTNADLIEVATKVLPKVKLLGCREGRTSPAALRSFGVAEGAWTVTGDDAIEIAAGTPTAKKRNAIGFNLRIAHYSDVETVAARLAATAVAATAAAVEAPIVNLPINLEGPNDHSAVEFALQGQSVRRLECEPAKTPQDLIDRIDQCRLVVTGSFHAAVFALARGTPVVAIASADHYRHKFGGLADLYPDGCVVIDSDIRSLAVSVQAATLRAWFEANALRQRIQHRTQVLLSRQRQFWGRLAEIV